MEGKTNDRGNKAKIDLMTRERKIEKGRRNEEEN